MLQYKPTILEKIIAGSTYLSSGVVSFIIIIVCVIKRTFPGKFLLYHVYQSLFLCILYVVVNGLFWLTVRILEYIPLINRIVRQLVYIFNHPLIFGYSFMQTLIFGVVIYLAVFAFMGLYSYLPFVSDIAMYSVNRRH